MRESAVLQVEEVVKQFGSGPTSVRAVDGVSLRVSRGEITLIMGPSGSGKTTLLSMMGGLLRPTSGRIVLAGRDIAKLSERELPAVRAHHVGFIFQAFNLLGALSVEENILLPAQLLPGGVEGARDRVNGLLDRLGLEARRGAYPRTLSGGEKQRVAIARALVNEAPLLLADEPTGNLDSERGREVTMLLHDIARDEGCAVVIVAHDTRIEDVADTLVWLEDGRLADRPAAGMSWTRDPVCGMAVDVSSSEFMMSYRGTRYVFCSRRCLERFESNPSMYAVGRSPPGEAS